jgi:hypothetical protein
MVSTALSTSEAVGAPKKAYRLIIRSRPPKEAMPGIMKQIPTTPRMESIVTSL